VDRQEAERLARRIDYRAAIPPGSARASDAPDAVARRLETGAGSPALARELRAIRLRRWALSSGEWPEQREAPRDWAETALEAGELLALRLPGRGKRLLDLAARLFEQAGDLPGAVISSIASVIASYHRGDADGASETLIQLQARYDRLRALPGSDLPAWGSLVGWARGRPEDAAAAGAWDGWLTRLGACLARRAGQRLEPSWPAAELDLRAAPRHRGVLSRAWRVTRAPLAVVWGLCWVLVTVIGCASFGRAALSALGWNPYPLVGWVVGLIGVIAAFAAAFGLLAALTPALMNLIGTQCRLIAAVEPVAPASGPPHQADLRVRVESRRRGLDPLAAYFRAVMSFGSALAAALSGQLFRPGSERRLDAELPLHPDPLRHALPPGLVRALSRARGLHIEELMLLIGSKAAPGAWEAALNLNQVSASDKGIDRTFRTFRLYAAHAPRPAPSRRPEVAVLCARPFALPAEASWEAGDVSPQLFSGEELRGFEHVPRADVLHLIGTPVPGELRPMLALEGSAAQVLQPDRLPLAQAALIIVQAEPTRSSVSADPRTGLLRAITHDMAVASAGAAVIAVPVLPGYLAAKLTEEIARALAGGLASRRDLLALVHRLRGLVFDAGNQQDAVAARALAAFDVCLYLGA
jgi:hypothetical protein